MPSKPSKNTTKTHRKPVVFNADDLLASLRGHIEHLSGKKKLTMRTRVVFVPDPIPRLKPRDIAAIRSKLKLSQPVFARVLNVPVATARSWESGRRKPTGAALRLLDLARRSPQALLDNS
jgi:putative transcriptional regulator